MKKWQIAINVFLFVLAALAVGFYRLHHEKVDPKSCIQQYAFAANQKLAKVEIARACEIMSRLDVPTKERALALCILRDAEKLVTNDKNALITYLEPCYKATLK